MTADQIILLIYAILLEAGGAMGFIKAGSKASVIASTIFAVVIFLFIFGVLPIEYAWTVVAFLVLFFGSRFARGRKFMPNGLMLVLSIVTLILIRVF
ncbi:MAG TPA: TMEM14 family protein [Candidatus Kapabacteria bacterium]|nr:TMEM14 family protein [Candidatus Kapabacteria bacterium]